MTYPIVRFVSAPDPSADVRFDFNSYGEWSDDDTWPEHDGFTLGVPSLEGDPDAYGTQYGLRELSFNVIIRGTYMDASRVWSQLAKELVGRRTNWLQFQFSEFSQPVWFKTYRSAPEALDFEQVLDTDDASTNLWGLGLTLTAEPFAYGERITLPTFTINNDPGAATNPCMAVLPPIMGDAPAPARYEMSTNVIHSIPSPMFSVTPVPDTYGAPVMVPFGTGDAVTPEVDMGPAVANGLFSGGSYRPVDFTTTTGMARRTTLTLPSLRPGRYALLLRVGTATFSDQFAFKVRIGNQIEGSTVSMDRPTSPSGSTQAYAQYVDLGTFSIPTGLQDFNAPNATTTSISIWAQRLAGTGAARFDALVVMPVEVFDGEPGMRLTTLPDFLREAPWRARWDGDDEYFQIYFGPGATGRNAAILAGQYPVLTPGRRNVMHLFRQTESAALPSGLGGDVRTTVENGDAISMTTTVTISYHPRWLWLAGA